VALGYRYLETDVHVTADGVLIAFHDDRLDRVTDRWGMVARLPWAEVRLARVAGSEPILRFEELLDAFPAARINVDPKHDAAVAPLIRAIRAAGALDRVCAGSFSDRRVAELRAGLGPGGCTSLSRREVVALRVGSWGIGPFRRALVRRPGLCVQVPLRGYGIRVVDGRLLEAAHQLGLPVHVWTIDDAATMNRLLDLGVDGLMSDRPALLREVLLARGSWTDPPRPPGRSTGRG
jgi:glycerophosphoryl diester phosphodiesterase